MSLKLYNKRGDTIVEVMIAIVVLGGALGGAFAITNKSQLVTQSNHERYQAQALASGQADLLRTSYANHLKIGGERLNYNPSGQCLNTLAEWKSGADCIAYQLYNITLTKIVSAGNVPGVTAITYQIVVDWDSLSSQGGIDTVEMLYGI